MPQSLEKNASKKKTSIIPKESSCDIKHAKSRQGSEKPRAGRRESPTSRTRSDSPKSILTQNESPSQGSITASVYVDHQLKKQVQARREVLVNWLMEASLECLHRQSSSVQAKLAAGARIINLAGQKRQLQRYDSDEEKENDSVSATKRGKDSKRARTDDHGELRYACPYLKYDKEQFGNVRTCCGPGFVDTHRLKEHLTRRHRRFECDRCYKLFPSEDELAQHHRQIKPCSMKQRDSVKRNPAAGFDKAQEKELKKRLRLSGPEKWTAWYCILFNVDPKSGKIPSPYFEKTETIKQKDTKASRACSKHSRYFDYLRKELPPLMKKVIEEEVDRAMAGFEETVKTSIWSKLQDLPHKVQRLVKNIPPPSPQIQDTDADYNVLAPPPTFDPASLLPDLNLPGFTILPQDMLFSFGALDVDSLGSSSFAETEDSTSFLTGASSVASFDRTAGDDAPMGRKSYHYQEAYAPY